MKDKFVLTRGMLILIILVILIIIGVVIGISISKSNNIQKYKDFESELESDAENYIIIKDIELEEGEERKITLSALKKQKLASNEDDLQNKCSGYVIVSNEENVETEEYELIYTAYIKCGKKYVTSNYSEY